MEAFDAIFGVGSATTAPLFQETSAFRRKDDQYVTGGSTEQGVSKQKQPLPAPALTAKPTRKRKAQKDLAKASVSEAEPAEADGRRLGKQAKKHAGADAAVPAHNGAEAQQQRKKQKLAVTAAAAAPSKPRAPPAMHQNQTQQTRKRTRVAADAGGDASEPAVAEADGSNEPPLQHEDAAPEQPAPPSRPVS